MRLFTLTVLFITLTTTAYAQTPRIQWQRTIGGDKDDELYAIQQTADGGYILGGSSNSGIFGDKTIGLCNNGTSFDFWIVKTDCEGHIVWQKSFGSTSNDIVNSIKQTRDGGYIVGGYTESGGASCDKTITGYGIADWWVMKLDNMGTLKWQVQLGGSCNDFLNSVEQTKDGGYILGGNTRSNQSGNKTVNMCGNASCQVLSDYWVVKLDSLGAIKWQQEYGSTATSSSGSYPGDDNLNVIHQTPDGGYILGGTSNGGISCSKTDNAYTSYDFWIIKIDSVGNIKWQKDIGGTGVDALNDLQLTADSGYIVGGTTTSGISGNKTNANWNASSDYYVVKLDSVGNIQWQKDIGGNGYDGLNSIEQTTDRGYILGGFSNSGISGDKTSNPLRLNQYDYWVVKLDNLGAIQWQLDIGRTDTQAVLFAAHQTTDGGYILGGVSNPSSANLSGKVNNVGNPYGDKFGGNGTHYWLVKLGDCRALYCGTPPKEQHFSICLGDSIKLKGISGFGAFNWTVAPGGSDINSLSCTACPNPTAKPDKTTQYIEVSAFNPNLYCGDTTTVVVIHAREGLALDTTVCAKDSIRLHLPDISAGTVTDIKWSPAYYLNSDTIANPLCAPLSSIAYYVSMRIMGKCKVVDTVRVTVDNRPKTMRTDTIICMHDSVQLHAPLDPSGVLNNIVWVPETYLSSNSVPDPYCKLPSSMTYLVTIDYANKCRIIDTFNVIVSDLVKPGITDTFICQHTVLPVIHVNADSLLWHTTATDAEGTLMQPNVGTAIPGYDTLYVSNRCGTAPVYIRIVATPAIPLADTAACKGSLVRLNAPASDDIQYKWSTGDASCCIVVDGPGMYIVQATNVCGDVTDTVNVFDPCNVCVWAPDAFTPNGDGRNDQFRVMNRCGTGGAYHIIIVNRFGETVFESNDVTEGWDGTYNGNPLGINTYFYWITMAPEMGGMQSVKLKGDVTLIR